MEHAREAVMLPPAVSEFFTFAFSLITGKLGWTSVTPFPCENQNLKVMAILNGTEVPTGLLLVTEFAKIQLYSLYGANKNYSFLEMCDKTAH